MSTLVELLVTRFEYWPTYQGNFVSTIVQDSKGTLWLNRPIPKRPPKWLGDGWNSDFVHDIRNTEVTDDHATAIITKEMWEEAKFWADAPPDATHRSDEIPDKYRAGFYKLNSDGVWVVWAPLSEAWLVSARCRRESDHSFLIPRPVALTQVQTRAPENDIDNW